MFFPKFVYMTKNAPFFSNFARFFTPKRCTRVQCLVLKNNPNYVNFWTSLIPPLTFEWPPGQLTDNQKLWRTTRNYNLFVRVTTPFIFSWRFLIWTLFQTVIQIQCKPMEYLLKIQKSVKRAPPPCRKLLHYLTLHTCSVLGTYVTVLYNNWFCTTT